MRIQIPIASSSAGNNLNAVDSRRLVNMYAEPSMGKADFVLKKRECLSYIVQAPGTFAVRGLYETSTNRLFGVRGNTLFEINTDDTITTRGTIGTTFGLVSLIDNGFDLVIADGSALYQFTLATNVLIQIADAQSPQNTPTVDFADGYVFGFNPDSANLGEYQFSGVDDVSAWSVLDVGIANKSPDKLVTLIVNNGDLWLFGSKSYEVHGNTGNLTDTWLVISGANGEIGCASKKSVVKHGGQIYWLGASKEGHAKIYRSNGYGYEEISTFREVSVISELGSIDDAVGLTYQYKGHAFYALTFQNGDITIVYDITTGLWHEETWRNPLTSLQERNLLICHAFFNNENYFGDRRNGKIYKLAGYSDEGQPVVCEIQFPHFEDKKQVIFWNWIEIDCEMGVGDYITEPLVQMCYSDDGGNTWSNWTNGSMGLTGQYSRRVRFNRLGRSRFGERVFKLRYSGNTKFNVLNRCIADIEEGI